jgi:hypothetical protein
MPAQNLSGILHLVGSNGLTKELHLGTPGRSKMDVSIGTPSAALDAVSVRVRWSTVV